MISENYVSLTPRLMKSFDRAVALAKPILIARYGEAEAKVLMRESRQKYIDLIPQFPYIGDNNPLINVFFFFIHSPPGNIQSISGTRQDGRGSGAAGVRNR